MGKSVRDLITERFGAPVHVAVNRSVASVGLTPVSILRNDPDRLGAVVVNLSLNRLYLGPFVDPSATKGVRLDANGANLGLNWFEDYDVTGWEWFAVADAAGSPVLVLEYLQG